MEPNAHRRRRSGAAADEFADTGVLWLHFHFRNLVEAGWGYMYRNRLALGVISYVGLRDHGRYGEQEHPAILKIAKCHRGYS